MHYLCCKSDCRLLKTQEGSQIVADLRCSAQIAKQCTGEPSTSFAAVL
jgi:hypothetical protein